MGLKVIIVLWISLIVLASCEHRADYLNWSRKVANYCKYVKYSEESKRYECGPKLGEFYTYIIIHPDYILPKNPIYPLVAYDGNDNVVMVGGNGRGQIWRMIKFEKWAFVRETKTGMKEVYYDEEEKAFIGLEIGDDKTNLKSKAWWSKDGGKSWVRAKVPVFNKKEENNSNSVLSVPPVVELTPKVAPTTSVLKPEAPTPVGEPEAPKIPVLKPLAPTPLVKPLAKAPAGPKLPVGATAEAVGGGYAVAIGEVGGKPMVWSSKATVPRNWEVTLEKDIKNPHTGSLPGSLQKTSLVDLKKVLFDGTDFRIEDGDGDVWISKNNGQSWDMGRFGGGSGTVGDPYKIASAIHLWLVREELNKHFELTNDLDLSVVTEKEGFDPIGDDTNQFQGTFDGKGKVIRKLKINRLGEWGVGLFGWLGGGGVVKNIGLEGVNVMESFLIGGLVGMNSGGTIENSYVTGSVTGTGSYVGGLVGWNKSGGRIKNSYATGAVTGSQYVGGLVGENEGTIEKSYATGNVTGTGIYVGGLVGYNHRTIGNSYATGNVTGSKGYVGGLVGLNSGTIGNSYAMGDVAGSYKVGGFIGHTNPGTRIYANYWKKGSASKGVGRGSEANVEEKTEDDLKALDAGETGWSTEIWNFQAEEYPKLKWQE